MTDAPPEAPRVDPLGQPVPQGPHIDLSKVHVGPIVAPLNKSTAPVSIQPQWPDPDGSHPSANWPQ